MMENIMREFDVFENIPSKKSTQNLPKLVTEPMVKRIKLDN